MDIKQRQAKHNRPAVFVQPTATSSPVTSPTPKTQKPSKSRKKLFLYLGLGIAVIVILLGYLFTVFLSEEESIDQPDYATILPQGKTIQTLGGWERVSPPENDPVFAYKDTIDGVAVIVSQQMLPKSFGRNTDSRVEELAKGYNATTKLQASDTLLYVGSSSEGPQSVIFTKDRLLVLIKSEKKIADRSWSAYVNSLSSASMNKIPTY